MTGCAQKVNLKGGKDQMCLRIIKTTDLTTEMIRNSQLLGNWSGNREDWLRNTEFRLRQLKSED